MARKKIRKNVGRKKELAQPDEVMSALQGTYDFIDKYKYHLIGALAGAIILVLGVSGWYSWQGSVREENTEAFFKVYELVGAPVVAEDSEEETEGKTFPTEEDKYKAVAEAASTFMDEHSGGGIEEAARMLRVTANMRLEENESAIGDLEEFLGNQDDSSLKPLALENLGVLRLRTDSADQAKEHFEAMKEASSEPYFQARALVHLGDMVNPLLGKGDSRDAEAARDLYNKALELLPEEEDSLLPSLRNLARQDIEMRLLLTPES